VPPVVSGHGMARRALTLSRGVVLGLDIDPREEIPAHTEAGCRTANGRTGVPCKHKLLKAVH
jgi:hypothetical protein